MHPTTSHELLRRYLKIFAKQHLRDSIFEKSYDFVISILAAVAKSNKKTVVVGNVNVEYIEEKL